MHDAYDYEPREHPAWSEFSDIQPGEPVIDYRIWPPEPPEPEAARGQSRRRLARLAWRVTLLSAVGAAAFAILFVRNAPGQSVVSPPTPAAATPAPSPRHQHPAASAALRPGHRAAAPKPAAQASPTLAPPAGPTPEPENSGRHSGRGGSGR